MITQRMKPSWAIRAAKWLSPGCEVVLIRFDDECEAVEIVHGSDVSSRDLIEAAQMALARIVGRVKS